MPPGSRDAALTSPVADAGPRLDSTPPAVLRLARRGWCLFPVAARSKRPLVAEWPERATRDLEVLEAWSLQFPGCNWGLACGPDSGVFVLDVDGDEGAAFLCGLIEVHGHEWTDTLNAKTARGSHLYFNYPADLVIRNSASKLARGVDVRGDGGFVIVPPSVHANGTEYTWGDSGENAPVAFAPAWLLERLFVSEHESAPTPTTASNTLIPKGKRNAVLTSLAGTMQRRGMSFDTIEVALLAENAKRCSPPLSETEVRGIARSVSRYAPASVPKNPEHETGNGGPLQCVHGGGRFESTWHGVFFIGTNKDGEEQPPRWICGRVQVVAMTRDAKSNAWGRLLEWPDSDGVWHRWAMPLELLQGDGVDVRSELARQGLNESNSPTVNSDFRQG